MIMKNSLRHVFRTPIKTTLFVLLLAGVTTFLSFGLNMQLSISQSIEAAMQIFKTVGIIEYRSPNSASHLTYDYDYSPIIDSEYVESFDHRAFLAGCSEGITIDQGSYNFFKDVYWLRIIEFTPLEISEDGKRIEALILDVLRSPDSSLKNDTVISLGFPMATQYIVDEKGYSLEVGRSYLTGVSRAYDDLFWVESPTLRSIRREWWPELLESEVPLEVFLETTEGDYLESDDGQVWGHILQLYDNSLKTMPICVTNDLETILSFHQGKVMISDGRAFSQEDYQEGNRVCIVSRSFARRKNISIGDFIPISFSETSSAVPTPRGYSVNSVNHRDILQHGDYQVIGYYQTSRLGEAREYGVVEETVFIPQKAIDFVPYETRDNFVSFRLTTGTVEAFQQEMEQYDLPGLNFTYYDQGYSKVSGVFTNMRETALLLTLVSAGAGLGLVLLFSLLFVGRQQRSIAVMYSLGAGRKRALAFLMLTVALVAVLAVGVGSLAGYVLSGPVATRAYESNVQAMTGDTDYGGIYGEDTEAAFQVVIPPRYHAPLVAAGGVLATTLVCSGLFAVAILRLEPMQVLSAKEE